MQEIYRTYSIAVRENRRMLKQPQAPSEPDTRLPETSPMYRPRSAKSEKAIRQFMAKQEKETLELRQDYLNPAFTSAYLRISRIQNTEPGGLNYNFGKHLADIVKNLPRYDSPRRGHRNGVSSGR